MTIGFVLQVGKATCVTSDQMTALITSAKMEQHVLMVTVDTPVNVQTATQVSTFDYNSVDFAKV